VRYVLKLGKPMLMTRWLCVLLVSPGKEGGEGLEINGINFTGGTNWTPIQKNQARDIKGRIYVCHEQRPQVFGTV
jgi:hypothetical protein